VQVEIAFIFSDANAIVAKVNYKLPKEEMEIGKRLRLFRQMLKIPRTAFALDIGISGERLASYESGRARLRYETFRALNAKYYIVPTWLATGTGIARASIPFDDAVFEGSIDPKRPFSEVYSSVLDGALSAIGYEFFHEITMCQSFVSKLQSLLESNTPETIAREGKKTVDILMNLTLKLSKQMLAVETLLHLAEHEIERQQTKTRSRRG
jgi:transcriptional regulator with XRE-family HTH domain